MQRREFLNTSLSIPLASTAAWSASALAYAHEHDEKRMPAARPLRNTNAVIEHARQVGLSVLKPSEKDLQHGLELHAASLVFDTYGFAPRAAVDGDVIAKAMEAGASNIELQDLREDMGMTRAATNAAELDEFQTAWEASGVTCIFQNAGEEGQDPMRLIKRLARFTFLTDMLRDYVPKAVTPEDIVEAKAKGRHCLYFTGNGVPLTQAWVSVEDELRYMRIFQQLGIRMMHLTYQRRNAIGDGCAETANGGLSDFGRHVVREMNRTGMIVDCAHSGWQTSLEAAQLSSRPMVASHSTCTALQHHIRSKPDEVIKAIADTGGLIGICCIPQFLGGNGDLNALLDHITYAVKKFGADHVGIGTDIAYTSRNAGEENKKIPRSGRKSRTRYEALWPADAFALKSDAAESLAWTNWPLYTVGLVQRGLSDEDIRKIIGENMLRVTREVLQTEDVPAAQEPA